MAIKRMFEQSEESRSASEWVEYIILYNILLLCELVSLEIHRLATDNSYLNQMKAESQSAMEKLAQKAASMVSWSTYCSSAYCTLTLQSVANASLQSRLDESHSKVQSLQEDIINIQVRTPGAVTRCDHVLAV